MNKERILALETLADCDNDYVKASVLLHRQAGSHTDKHFLYTVLHELQYLELHEVNAVRELQALKERHEMREAIKRRK